MIHHINFRVIAHATEDLSKVDSALDFFLGVACAPRGGHASGTLAECAADASLKAELNNLKETIETEGHFGNPIHIKTAVLKKKAACSKFVQFFKDNISEEDLETLREQMPERLDDDLNFYMRFSKQAAANGKLKFTESSDAISVRVKIETYPKSWEKAGPIVEELFGQK
ncbi:MAG: exosome subunit [Methanosarcinales archaeon]|nr:exosome subunit [Methanosarcinales archaeon]